MASVACIEPTIEPEVFEVLRKNKAEAAFQTACDVARSSFPKMLSLHVDLLEDPDINNHIWVILNVLLPQTHPMDFSHSEQRRYHEKMVDQIPREFSLLFSLSVNFQPE